MFTQDDMVHVLCVTRARVSSLISVGNLAEAQVELERTQRMIDDERVYQITKESSVEQAGIDEPTAEKLAMHGLITLYDVEQFINDFDNGRTGKKRRIGLKTVKLLRSLIERVTSMPEICGYEAIIECVDENNQVTLPINGRKVRVLIKPSSAEVERVEVSAKLCGCDGISEDIIMAPVQCTYSYPYWETQIAFNSTKAAAGIKCWLVATVTGENGCQENFYRKIMIGNRE